MHFFWKYPGNFDTIVVKYYLSSYIVSKFKNGDIRMIMIKRYLVFLNILVILAFACPALVVAQECGPSCPVCSGGSQSTIQEPQSFLITNIYIPGGEDETNVLRLRYGIFSWLDAGIGYTFSEEKLTWSVRAQVISENEKGWRPGLLMGTGSVRIGGSDQSLYFQVTKSLEFSEGFALRISGGMATLLPDVDRLYGLAAITLTVTEQFSAFVNYDGNNFHPGISWIPLDWLTVSGILIESRDFALATGIRWKL